jgi:hypothetical protein
MKLGGTMRILGVVLLYVTALSCSPMARAIDCSDIKPVAPQNSQTTSGGAADGHIDGLFKKLLGIEARGNFDYQKAITNILPQFPDADRLYVWERILFVQCETINEDKTLDTRTKLAAFNDLLRLYSQPPPAVSSAAASNAMTNNGNNVNAVQGNGNSISVGGKP